MKRNRRAGVEDRWTKTVRDADGNTQAVPSAGYGNGKRWRARYVDDQGREHSKGFGRKVDAQQWLDEFTAAVVTGQYVDPKAGQITFRDYAERWRAMQVQRPSSRAHIETMLRSACLSGVGRPLPCVDHAQRHTGMGQGAAVGAGHGRGGSRHSFHGDEGGNPGSADRGESV